MDKKQKVLLLGYGRYGEPIAQQLEAQDYEVYVADENKESLKHASQHGLQNLLLVDIENDEQLTDIIFDNGIDLIFCTFDEEEKNIYLTITFKALFRHLTVVALCESKESERKLKLAGADRVIDTMEAAANRIYFLVEKPAVAEAFDHILFKDKNLEFKEIEIPENSFLDGVNIKDFDISKRFDIVVIGIVDKELGNHFIFITRGINHKIDAGDILVVIGRKDEVQRFEEELKKAKK